VQPGQGPLRLGVRGSPHRFRPDVFAVAKLKAMAAGADVLQPIWDRPVRHIRDWKRAIGDARLGLSEASREMGLASIPRLDHHPNTAKSPKYLMPWTFRSGMLTRLHRDGQQLLGSADASLALLKECFPDQNSWIDNMCPKTNRTVSGLMQALDYTSDLALLTMWLCLHNDKALDGISISWLQDHALQLREWGLNFRTSHGFWPHPAVAVEGIMATPRPPNCVRVGDLHQARRAKPRPSLDESEFESVAKLGSPDLPEDIPSFSTPQCNSKKRSLSSDISVDAGPLPAVRRRIIGKISHQEWISASSAAHKFSADQPAEESSGSCGATASAEAVETSPGLPASPGTTLGTVEPLKLPATPITPRDSRMSNNGAAMPGRQEVINVDAEIHERAAPLPGVPPAASSPLPESRSGGIRMDPAQNELFL